jgi:hypothetical protein
MAALWASIIFIEDAHDSATSSDGMRMLVMVVVMVDAQDNAKPLPK